MKRIVALFFMATLYSCMGPSKIIDQESNKIKNDTMEYFNIDKYKDWEKDSYYLSDEISKFLKRGDERVVINFYNSGIKVSTSNINTPYKKNKGFSNITKGLQIQGFNFYQFSIGIDEYYDENGKVIKEVDNDKPYLFSLEQLIVKVKKEYNVDLETKVSGMLVNRMVSEYLKKPVYEVNLPCEDNELKRQYILIDGNTGNTLFETFYFMQSEEMNPFSRYLVALYNKEQEDNAYYKTYNGKDYTKKEWEAFEEEWYKNYKENKNKGFWDDIFPGRKKN